MGELECTPREYAGAILAACALAGVGRLLRADGYQPSAIRNQKSGTLSDNQIDAYRAAGALFPTAFDSGLRWGGSRAHERKHTDSERSRDQQGTLSRASRNAAFLQRLATGGGAAHALEQPGPGRGGKAGRAGGLWRHG